MLNATSVQTSGGTTQTYATPGAAPQYVFSIAAGQQPGYVPAAVVLDGNGYPAYGGANAAVAAGTGTAAAVVKASPGRLCKVIVTALGTAALSIYDNASAASGTVLLTIPASAAVGTIYDVQMPAANGITAGQVSNSPAVTVAYS